MKLALFYIKFICSLFDLILYAIANWNWGNLVDFIWKLICKNWKYLYFFIIIEKLPKISQKTTFFAVSVFRWVDRKIRPKYFGRFDRNFGRNFGFGRTLYIHVLDSRYSLSKRLNKIQTVQLWSFIYCMNCLLRSSYWSSLYLCRLVSKRLDS